MVRIFHPFLFLLARATDDGLQKQNEFLKAENEMLRKRVPKKHIVLEPAERDKLLKLGKELGPAIRWLITIVSYSTFRRWVRKERAKPARREKAGRGWLRSSESWSCRLPMTRVGGTPEFWAR